MTPTVNEQIFITSINKAINRAKLTGNFNSTIMSIVELLIYYIEYVDALIDLGAISLFDTSRELKKMLVDLRYRYPSIICNYKNVLPSTGTVIPTPNTPPTIDDNSVNLGDEQIYQFTAGDFLLNYADAENHAHKYLLIPTPTSVTEGDIAVTGWTVPLGEDLGISERVPTDSITLNLQQYAPEDLIPLEYERTNQEAFGPDVFNFRISDNPINFLYSLSHTMSVYATITEEANQAPTDVGDNTIYVGNRVVTVLTLFMFTGGLQPPYNDPEGDLIDAIRVLDISNANAGIFYVNGIQVWDGQIIDRETINSGVFTHEAPDQDAISSDVFKFEARDEGSGIWVE